MPFRALLSALALLTVVGTWIWVFEGDVLCDQLADAQCGDNNNGFIILVALAVSGSLGPAALAVNIELDGSRPTVWFRRQEWVRAILYVSAVPWLLAGFFLWFVLPFVWAFAAPLGLAARALGPDRAGRDHTVRMIAGAIVLCMAAAALFVGVSVAGVGGRG